MVYDTEEDDGEYKRCLSLVFVDLRKAFNKITRKLL